MDFEDGLSTQTACVRLSLTGWLLFHEQQPQLADAAEAQAGESDAESWREADLAIEAGNREVRGLRRLGSEVQVLAPLDTRAALAAEAARIVDRHARDATELRVLRRRPAGRRGRGVCLLLRMHVLRELRAASLGRPLPELRWWPADAAAARR
jgi:hypothetical protein